jgi:hypothetical protein
MIRVYNRLWGVEYAVGTRGVEAAFTEYKRVDPGDLSLRNESHAVDILLCQRHDGEFRKKVLTGIVAACGDTIMEAEL